MMHPRRAIDTFLEEGLSTDKEARMQAHISQCTACQQYYEEQVLLFRALAGDIQVPTFREEQRVSQAVLQRMGLLKGKAERGGLAEQHFVGVARFFTRVFSAVPSVLLVLTYKFRFLAFGQMRHNMLLMAFGLLVVSGGVLYSVSSDATPIAVVTEASSGFRVGGTLRQQGDEIFSLEPIHTGTNGIARLKLLGGGTEEGRGELRIYPETDMRFEASGAVLSLDNGRVWCLINKKAERSFAVHTQEGRAEVTGTSFVVARSADDHTTEVRVIEGSVRVKDSEDIGQVSVRAHQRTVVHKGSAPSEVEAYFPHVDRDEWSRFWRRFLRTLKHELREGVRALKKVLRP